MGEWLGRGKEGCMRLKRGKRTSVSGEAAEHDCWGLETGSHRERGKETRDTGQKSHHPTAFLLFFFFFSLNFPTTFNLSTSPGISPCAQPGSLKSRETVAEHQHCARSIQKGRSFMPNVQRKKKKIDSLV